MSSEYVMVTWDAQNSLWRLAIGKAEDVANVLRDRSAHPHEADEPCQVYVLDERPPSSGGGVLAETVPVVRKTGYRQYQVAMRRPDGAHDTVDFHL